EVRAHALLRFFCQSSSCREHPARACSDRPGRSSPLPPRESQTATSLSGLSPRCDGQSQPTIGIGRRSPLATASQRRMTRPLLCVTRLLLRPLLGRACEWSARLLLSKFNHRSRLVVSSSEILSPRSHIPLI